MTRFSIGDLVVLRFGERQGQKGRILQGQSADGYMVKVEDGSIQCFSAKGLEMEKTGVRAAVSQKP